MSMTCHRIRPRLSSYLDGESPIPEREAIRGHLESCPDCREEVGRLSRDREMLLGLADGDIPVGLRTRVMAEIRARNATRATRSPAWVRAVGIAATVVVIAGSALAGVALGSSMARMSQPPPEETSQSSRE